MLIKFDQYRFVLMPKTRDHVQSIHVDLTANRLKDAEAMTLANRFLSLMTWCDDQFAIAQGGWSGNPVPVPVLKRNLAFTTTYNWVFNRKLPASDEVRRALALYREARNAQQNAMISYAVLNYFKVIELRFHNGPLAKDWIRKNFDSISLKSDRDPMERFLAVCGSEPPEEYIYKACRNAVAHASPRHRSDPDHLDELRRLHAAADIMRRLARHFIKSELGVSDVSCSGD